MLKNAAFALGLWLMGLNLIGLFVPERSDRLRDETATYFVDDLSLGVDDFYQQLAMLDSQNRSEYFIQLSRLISQAILHYWQPEQQAEYRLLLPWTENFILRALAYINPQFFAMYEFRDHHKAIARGVGLCSQHALIMAGLLAEQGIASRLVELQGHVILTAEVEEGRWWLLDPDYGIVLPFSLMEAEENSQAVAAYYQRAGFSDYDVDKLEELFRTPDNVLYDEGAHNYLPWLYVTERSAYVAKWVLPLALLLPALLTYPAFGWQMLHCLRCRRLVSMNHQPYPVQNSAGCSK